MKKRLLIGHDLIEELTFEEVIEKYQNFLNKAVYKMHEYATKKYFNHSFFLDYDDLMQVAYMKSYDVYNEYDINKGFLFYTYLKQSIEKGLLRYVYEKSGQRRSSNGYEFKHLSLDNQIDKNNNGDKDIGIGELIADNSDFVEDLLSHNYLRDLLSILNDEERLFIKYRYIDEKTQQETGKILNMTQVSVSRKEKRIFKKIREYDNIKKRYEGENDMAVFNVQKLVKYLEKHASPDVAITNVINNFADKNKMSRSTAFTALTTRAEEDFERLKLEYKQNLPRNRKSNKNIEVKEKMKIELLSETEPKPIETNIITKETAKEEISDLFKEVRIKHMLLELKGLEATIYDNKVSLTISREDSEFLDINQLYSLKDGIDKVINILKSLNTSTKREIPNV